MDGEPRSCPNDYLQHAIEIAGRLLAQGTEEAVADAIEVLRDAVDPEILLDRYLAKLDHSQDDDGYASGTEFVEGDDGQAEGQ